MGNNFSMMIEEQTGDRDAILTIEYEGSMYEVVSCLNLSVMMVKLPCTSQREQIAAKMQHYLIYQPYCSHYRAQGPQYVGNTRLLIAY